MTSSFPLRLPCLVVAVFALIAVSSPNLALACSCSGRLSRQVQGAGISQAWPTNAVLRVFFSGPWNHNAILAAAEGYRLKTYIGEVVELESSVNLNRLDLRPKALLPLTHYVLEQNLGVGLDAANHAGVAMQGSMAAQTSKPRWSTVLRFQTLESAHEALPPEPKVGGGLMKNLLGASDCGPGTRVSFKIDSSSGATPWTVYEVYSEAGYLIATGSALSSPRVRFGNGLCDEPKIFTPDELPLAYRVRLVGPAGLPGPISWVSIEAFASPWDPFSF